jgi:hypothetical protein
MKRKQSTAHMTISVPTSLKQDMERHPQINWSVVASAAFKKRLNVEEILGSFAEEGISEEEAIKRSLSIERVSKPVDSL